MGDKEKALLKKILVETYKKKFGLEDDSNYVKRDPEKEKKWQEGKGQFYWIIYTQLRKHPSWGFWGLLEREKVRRQVEKDVEELLEDFGLEFDIDIKEDDEGRKDDKISSLIESRFLKKSFVKWEMPQPVVYKKFKYTSFWQIFWKKWKEREMSEERKWEEQTSKLWFIPRMFARIKHWIWKQIKKFLIEIVKNFSKELFKWDYKIFWKSWYSETVNRRYLDDTNSIDWDERFYWVRNIYLQQRRSKFTSKMHTLFWWQNRAWFYSKYIKVTCGEIKGDPSTLYYTSDPILVKKIFWWDPTGKKWLWLNENLFKGPDFFSKDIFKHCFWTYWKFYVWYQNLDSFSFIFTIMSFFFWDRNTLMGSIDWFIFFYLNELVDFMHI